MRNIIFTYLLLVFTVIITGCNKEEVIVPDEHFGYGKFEAKLNGRKWKGLGEYDHYDSTGALFLRFQCDDYWFDFYGGLYISGLHLEEGTYPISQYDSAKSYFTDTYESDATQLSYTRWLYGDQFVNSYSSDPDGMITITSFDEKSGELVGVIEDAVLIPRYTNGEKVLGATTHVELKKMKIKDFHFTIYEKLE